MSKEILLRCREDGIWEEYKEPYITISCPTEEDFRYLEEAVNYYKQYLDGNRPLTLDELRKMQGEPVWVHNLEVGKSFWMLAYEDAVNNRAGYLAYSSYGKRWLAYRNKPIEG